MRGFPRATLLVLAVAGTIVLVASGLGQWIPSDRAPEGGALMTPGEERVTIDVRNAGGVDGMARTATDHLRAAGFDVVSLGNAGTFGHDTTVVIDRVGDPERAGAVARALGVTRVTSEPDSNLFVDVTVRLGSGWSAPLDGERDRARAPDPAWARVVEWFRGLGETR